MSSEKRPGYWERYHKLCAVPSSVCRGTSKALLLDLHAKQGDNEDCWHAAATLAADLGVSERTIRRALSVLVDLRLITREHRPGRSSRYAIDWAGVQDAIDDAPSLFSEPRTHCPPTPDKLTHPPRTECHPTGDTVTDEHQRNSEQNKQNRPTVGRGKKDSETSPRRDSVTLEVLMRVVATKDVKRFRDVDAILAKRFHWSSRDGLGERDRLALWHRAASGRYRDGSRMKDRVAVLICALQSRNRRFIDDSDIEWASTLLRPVRQVVNPLAATLAKTRATPAEPPAVEGRVKADELRRWMQQQPSRPAEKASA